VSACHELDMCSDDFTQGRRRKKERKKGLCQGLAPVWCCVTIIMNESRIVNESRVALFHGLEGEED